MEKDSRLRPQAETQPSSKIEDDTKNWLLLREEDAEYFQANLRERYYLRDLFPDEKHPFLVDAEKLQAQLPHPTTIKIVAIRLYSPRAIARVPVLQRNDKPTQIFISRADTESKIYLRQPYTLDVMVGRLLQGFRKTLVLQGLIFDGSCYNCGLCFRTGDMVGGDDTGTDVHLYCAYCMERRILTGKKVDAAIIANIENDEINDEERERAAAVINEITSKLRPLVEARSQIFEMAKYVMPFIQKLK